MMPSLISAAVSSVDRALAESADKLLRLECESSIRLVDLIDELSAVDGNRRFGLTRPFKKSGIRRVKVSSDANTITTWRNEAIAKRRAAPVIIIGNASGAEEAGLRKVRTVITHNQVLREYQRLLKAWVRDRSEVGGIGALVASLVGMAEDGLIDSGEVEEFFAMSFADVDKLHLMPQKNLWMVGLFPDKRVLDAGSQGARLNLNHRTITSLLYSADGTKEEKQLSRILAAVDAGQLRAAELLKFQQTKKREVLKLLELDEVLELLQAAKPPRPGKTIERRAPLGLLSDGLVTEELQDQIASLWDLDDDEVDVSHPIGEELLVIRGKKREDDVFTTPAGEQILCTIRGFASDKEQAIRYVENELISRAGEASLFLDDSSLLARTEELLAARKDVLFLNEWPDSLLDLLVIRKGLRDAAHRYLESWRSLSTSIVRYEGAPHVDSLRQLVAALDADWESHEDPSTAEFNSVCLYPIHPYVLGPCLELIRYISAAATRDNLEDQVEWALDRMLPAYPAIWAGTKTLIHKGGSFRPEYSVRAKAARPDATAAGGFSDVMKAFLGLHPYAEHGLSILAVDPPNGAGLPAACKSIARDDVSDVGVHVLHTDTGFVDWSANIQNVTYLGRVESVTAWAQRTDIRAHIAFVFRAAHPGGTGSHTGDYGPSKGLQNALTFSVSAAPLGSLSQQDERIATVSVQPRNANDVVLTVMQLARASNREDRFFQVNPMLDLQGIEDIKAVAVLAEWVVVVTPSPIGLIPPRKFGNSDLVYLGREEAGVYSLFVYSRDLFPVRKHLQQKIVEAPVLPNRTQLEAQLESLSVSVPNGVLRIGRTKQDVTSHIGLMASSFLTRGQQ